MCVCVCVHVCVCVCHVTGDYVFLGSDGVVDNFQADPDTIKLETPSTHKVGCEDTHTHTHTHTIAFFSRARKPETLLLLLLLLV